MMTESQEKEIAELDEAVFVLVSGGSRGTMDPNG